MRSSSTDKKRTTVDRTHPHSGAGLYESALPRSPAVVPGKYSQSRSTISNFSATGSLAVGVDHITPVLVAIRDENEQFKDQKEKLSAQLKDLEHMAQVLLSQNQALRLHYKERCNDLGALIHTLTLNTNEEMADTRHLVYFYKEHNTILAKNIERINSRSAQREQCTAQMDSKLQALTREIAEGNQNLRARAVKNKTVQNNIDKMERVRGNSLEQLEKQVCNLLIENNNLMKKNKMTLNYIRDQKYSMDIKKPEIKHSALQAINSAKLLRQEIELLQKQYKKHQNKAEELITAKQNTINKYLNLYASQQAKTSTLRQLQDSKKQAEANSQAANSRINTVGAELDRKESERNKLARQVQNKREELANNAQKFQARKAKIVDEADSRVSSIKQQIRKSELGMNKTIINQLNPEKASSETTIQHLHQELQQLTEEVASLQDKLKGMPNPAREIMKIKMQLNQVRN